MNGVAVEVSIAVPVPVPSPADTCGTVLTFLLCVSLSISFHILDFFNFPNDTKFWTLSEPEPNSIPLTLMFLILFWKDKDEGLRYWLFLDFMKVFYLFFPQPLLLLSLTSVSVSSLLLFFLPHLLSQPRNTKSVLSPVVLQTSFGSDRSTGYTILDDTFTTSLLLPTVKPYLVEST